MVIDDMVPVGHSKVWQLLHDFYVQQGPQAWSEDKVPQGSTSNAYIADAYAAIVAAFLRDTRGSSLESPIILELGGGNGRFAWQFLQRLLEYHWRAEEESDPAFTYLLTDAAPSNLAAWQANTRLRDLSDRGLLAFGLLKIDEQPQIRLGDETLTPADFANRPLILIANYVFDTLPSDLYSVQNGQLCQVCMSLQSDDADTAAGRPRDFENLQVHYETRPLGQSATGIALLDDIVNTYPKQGRDCTIPIPRLGFQLVQAFTARETPLLLLAGDLAYTDPSNFPNHPPFIFDSYFAHYTNFHVIAELFRRQGGGVQFQRQHDPDFCASAFWLPVKTAHSAGDARLRLTREVARHQLAEFSPYDAHELNDLLKEQMGEASFRQVFSWLRLSRFDPDVAQACLMPLLEAIHRSDEGLNRAQLYTMYMEAYNLYFPDGSDVTFDYAIAQLLLAIRYDVQALALLQESLQEFGRKPERLYVLALVLLRLQRKDEARTVLEEAMQAKADFLPAMRVYDEHFGAPRPAADPELDAFTVSSQDADVAPKALAIFEEQGAVLVKNLFPRPYIDTLRAHFMARFEEWRNGEMGKPNFVGNKRYTFPVRVQAPFNDPALFAPPLLIDLLTEHMGARPIINAFGAVVTYPGANSQHVHREHPLLFTRDDHNEGLPAHAVTVLIPLVDLDEELGGTQLWTGTHRTGVDDLWEGPSQVVYTQKGDALMFDYRTYHGGMPCTSQYLRPVLFISFSLPWFRDTLAFESHDALAVSEQDLAAIPEDFHDLFRFARKIDSAAV